MATCGCSAGTRPRREVGDDLVDLGPPRPDSAVGKGEEDAAILPIGSDSRGVAPIVGNLTAAASSNSAAVLGREERGTEQGKRGKWGR